MLLSKESDNQVWLNLKDPPTHLGEYIYLKEYLQVTEKSSETVHFNSLIDKAFDRKSKDEIDDFFFSNPPNSNNPK